LNEDAERFALALLWALCRAASECRRVGLQPCEASMIVLMSDRKQNRGSLARGGRANVVGCRLRRREGANRFDDLQLAARWERREP
jgi:hypothetical protein